MPEYHGKLADPEFRRARASKGGKARSSLDSYVRQVVDRAPELTEEQRAKLALIILRGGANARGDSA